MAQPKPLLAWVDKICASEQPIFNRTAQAIADVAMNDAASVGTLAEVILQDAVMTTRILRLVNSVQYNPIGPPIQTISRAIMVLGFANVHQLSLSIGLIDAMLRTPAQGRIRRLLARSFHAAVQARTYAVARHELHPEELFIVALLFRVGELSFWCCAGSTGDQLERAVAAHKGNLAEAEYEVLGFRLFQLTAALVREWKLNPMLADVTVGRVAQGSREQSVLLGWRIAEQAEKGWHTERMQAAIADVSRYVGLRNAATTALVYAAASEAGQIATTYGADASAPLIPLPPEFSVESLERDA